MDKILKIADELTDEFLNSEAYKEYERLIIEIERDAELRQKLESFYRASEAFEQKKAGGSEYSFDDERILSNKYAELWLNETAGRFMSVKKELFNTLEAVREKIESKCGL